MYPAMRRRIGAQSYSLSNMSLRIRVPRRVGGLPTGIGGSWMGWECSCRCLWQRTRSLSACDTSAGSPWSLKIAAVVVSADGSELVGGVVLLPLP
jgi:hypothetical protein